MLFVTPGQNAFAARLVKIADADRGKTIELSPGDTLIISIETNPGTGYSWRVGKNDGAILKYVEQFIFPPKSTVPGAPALQRIKFRALSAGTDSLELEYVRPWEKGVAPAKTYSVTVAVK